MKNNLPFLLFFLLPLTASAQTGSYDSVAIFILDHMSDVVGDMGACSYTLDVDNDVLSSDGVGLITQSMRYDVKMVGPDRMQVDARGDKGHRGYWYNGETMAFYSYNENNYVVVDAPDNIIETIDTISNRYGIDFPAADFFYPEFTDDLMRHFSRIVFVGSSRVGEKDCFHILASAKDMDVQFWIANDATTLPVKMLIMYHGRTDAAQYEAEFSNWVINPIMTASTFDFFPPPGAKEIAIMRRQ